MGLTAYRRKRDFAQTPEPGGRATGRGTRGKQAGPIFVVQKHSATRGAAAGARVGTARRRNRRSSSSDAG